MSVGQTSVYALDENGKLLFFKIFNVLTGHGGAHL